MKRSVNYWTRKLHRWGALVCCLPLLLVIATGLLLQVKKQVPWVQPATQSAKHSNFESESSISWDDILEHARRAPDAGIQSWKDIDRLDVRPSKGIVKIQAKSRWELQMDLSDGAIMSSEYRRSDLIESLHDGSFFGDWSKLALFLPNGLVLLGLWLTGAWLWYLPIKVKREKRQRKLAAKREERSS